MSNWQQDNNLHADEFAGLDELSALYQDSKTIQPSRQLDQAIRTAARTAVKPAAVAKTKTKTGTQLRWTPMFAAAATLILAVGVINLLQQQNNNALQPLPAQIPAPEPAGITTEIQSAPLLLQSGVKSDALAKPAPRITTLNSMPAAPVATDQFVNNAKPLVNTVIETSEPLLEPQQWLEKMTTLQQQNRLLELKVELQAFKRYYPTYELPAELDIQ